MPASAVLSDAIAVATWAVGSAVLVVAGGTVVVVSAVGAVGGFERSLPKKYHSPPMIRTSGMTHISQFMLVAVLAVALRPACCTEKPAVRRPDRASLPLNRLLSPAGSEAAMESFCERSRLVILPASRPPASCLMPFMMKGATSPISDDTLPWFNPLNLLIAVVTASSDEPPISEERTPSPLSASELAFPDPSV